MESKITIRQNPETKPVIKKPLTVDGKQVFNISELMLKRQSGKTLTVKEEQVLNDYLMHENCKKLTEKSKPLPTLAEVKAKMARGEKLTSAEMQVLFDSIKKTEAEYAAHRKNAIAELNMRNSGKLAKTEFPPKPYPTAGDRYLQQQEALRKFENSAMLKGTVYRPLDNNPKGGFERAMDKMRQLGETKAELTEKSAKMAEKFAKILEFCKKYGKSIKA